MKKLVDYEKKLRSVETEIMWNQQVFAGSHDPEQKRRVNERLTRLEGERVELKGIIRDWGKAA